MEQQTREEKDSLGVKRIPSDAYYGIQTARAVENFQISGVTAFPELIDAIVLIKRAAATVNAGLGVLPQKKAEAIISAADDILEGRFRDQFVVDVFQAGAGTSHNMNTNEVIANVAEERLGGQRGRYQLVHPNDHVNMGQSTNDVIPTAIRIALAKMVPILIDEMKSLATAIAQKGTRFDEIIKSGRTHLQDAVPIRLGQEFKAYSVSLLRHAKHFHAAWLEILELGIGGTAVGTGMNAHEDYARMMVEELTCLTGLPFRETANLMEAMQSQAPVVRVSGASRDFAADMIRIANDLRLLSSGPTTGLGEIVLPSVQPGSSIMPGKVNPVIAECMNMICFQVLGNDTAIAYAAQAGQLELNVMMPLMANSIIQSIKILTNGCRMLREKCVEGIIANADRCLSYAERTMGLATALSPHLGYQQAAEVAKESLATSRSIKDIVLEKRLLPPEKLARILDTHIMTEPGIPGGSVSIEQGKADSAVEPDKKQD